MYTDYLQIDHNEDENVIELCNKMVLSLIEINSMTEVSAWSHCSCIGEN